VIHTLYIEAEDTFLEVKKKFRKYLMTGGGVIRLKEGLISSDLDKLEREFSPHLESNGIAEEVLKQIEACRSTT